MPRKQPTHTFFLSELCPLFPLSHGVINQRFLQSTLDLPRNLKIGGTVFGKPSMHHNQKRLRTLTFFPASLMVCSIVTLTPFSST
jgi:hypothetical protein